MNVKEKEVIRRSVFEWLGESGQTIVLCAHATRPGSFSTDPVFPDKLNVPGYARKMKTIFAAKEDDAGVAKTETRAGRTVILSYGKHVAGLEKTAFNRIKRIHKKNAKKNADFLEDAWRAVYRYRTLGMFSGMSASVPPEIYRKLRAIEPRATECFASFFNHTLEGGYRGLFPDVEANFGCRGSFFGMNKPLPMMLCNPPFDRCVINAFIDHIVTLLDSGPGSAIVILPVFDVDDRKMLNDSDKCKSKYPTDYKTDTNTEKLKVSPYTKWHGMYCKERFPYLEMSTRRTVAYTSTMVLYMSSYKKQRSETVERIICVFPTPDFQTRIV